MRNNLDDLNNYLFEQIEMINDDSLTNEALAVEIDRSRAITKVASKIVDISRIRFEGLKFLNEGGATNQEAKFLGIKTQDHESN